MSLRSWRNFAVVGIAAALATSAAAAQSKPSGEPEVAPAAERALPAPVVQNYQPRPAMWLLEDADTKIYLLGTIHVLPPGFRWRSPAIERVIADADELVLETYQQGEDDIPPGAAQLFALDTPRPILGRVPADKRTALAEVIADGPLPIEAYAGLRTWAAALMIGMGGLLEEYGVDDVDDAPGVEEKLEADFEAAGKPIGQIEDPLAVLQSLNALPEAAQQELLLSSIEDEAAGADGEETEDDDAWAQGKAERLADSLEGLPPALFDVMVRRRNAAWTDWLARRLDKPGTVLLAVGAGHLAGTESVQTMLEARGLRVKRFD
ncbi:TraB/GumN family protein [Sphingosinicella sp. BN140058]|uniref:TraB/GumN family protein n=1 Tax=Sphingosinicella sp. BN140058 TaxID=1892855 RepID=UPI0013EB2773|nr:TraB/GumN family protein [Sphingosinicella sp. BN140058]